MKLEKDGTTPSCTCCTCCMWLDAEIVDFGIDLRGQMIQIFASEKSDFFSLIPSPTHHQDWVLLPVFGLDVLMRQTYSYCFNSNFLASLPEDGTASNRTWQTGGNILMFIYSSSPSKTCFLQFLTSRLISCDPSTLVIGVLVS